MKLLIITFFLLLSIHISAQENDLEKKLGHDTFPYLTTLKNAVANRDTVLIGAVMLLRGKHYEAQKMRREAIREYNKAYQLDSTRFKIASVYAKNVKLGMDAEHSTVLSQIEEESSRRTAVTRSVVVTTAAVAQAYNESKNQTSEAGSSSSGGFTTSNTNNNTTSSSPIIDNGQVCPICKGRGKCSGSDNKYCLGSKKCQYCGGNGYYFSYGNKVMCSNCNTPGNNIKNIRGDGVCSYCHGTGVCHKCGGLKK